MTKSNRPSNVVSIPGATRPKLASPRIALRLIVCICTLAIIAPMAARAQLIGDAIQSNDRDPDANIVQDDLFDDSCLHLEVDNLVGGELAQFTITGGIPGTSAVTVYGGSRGVTIVDHVANYCATFGIDGVIYQRIIDGIGKKFDASGRITFVKHVHILRAGRTYLFQSAARNTCPDECLSNIVEKTVL